MQVDMTSEGRPALRASAGALSMTAGIVHVLLAAQHVDWAADLAMFGAVGLAQVIWGATVLARHGVTPSWLWAGAGLQAVCVAAWAVSRLVGLPVGHHAGEAQAVGLLDGIVTASQLVALAAAVGLATGVRAGRRMVVATMVALVLAPAGTGVAIEIDDEHDHEHDEHDHEHEHEHDEHDHEHG